MYAFTVDNIDLQGTQGRAWPLRQTAHPRGQEGPLCLLRAGFLYPGRGPVGYRMSSCLGEHGNLPDCWHWGHTRNTSIFQSVPGGGEASGGLDPGQAHCGGLLSLPAKRKMRLVHQLTSSRQRGGCLWPGSLPSSLPGGPSATASPKEESRSPKLCPRGQHSWKGRERLWVWEVETRHRIIGKDLTTAAQSSEGSSLSCKVKKPGHGGQAACGRGERGNPAPRSAPLNLSKTQAARLTQLPTLT